MEKRTSGKCFISTLQTFSYGLVWSTPYNRNTFWAGNMVVALPKVFEVHLVKVGKMARVALIWRLTHIAKIIGSNHCLLPGLTSHIIINYYSFSSHHVFLAFFPFRYIARVPRSFRSAGCYEDGPKGIVGTFAIGLETPTDPRAACCPITCDECGGAGCGRAGNHNGECCIEDVTDEHDPCYWEDQTTSPCTMSTSKWFLRPMCRSMEL